MIHIFRLSESLLKLKLRGCRLKPLAVMCVADAAPESKLELLDLSVNKVGAKALPKAHVAGSSPFGRRAAYHVPAGASQALGMAHGEHTKDVEMPLGAYTHAERGTT